MEIRPTQDRRSFGRLRQTSLENLLDPDHREKSRLLSKCQKEPNGNGVAKYIWKPLPVFFLIHLLADLQRVEKGMTWLITAGGLGLLLVSPIFARRKAIKRLHGGNCAESFGISET